MHRWPISLVALTLALGCRDQTRSGSPRPSPSAAPTGQPSSTRARGPHHAPVASESVDIPSGTVRAGSRPGVEGRHPQIEPIETSIELGGYSIDRLAYPNDPRLPPLTGVTRDEAKARCAERGSRLCTELEWERACRGPNNEEYSTGLRFEAPCSKHPFSCASGFDVLAMGVAVREWTASDVLDPDTSASRGAAVRGAPASAPAGDHRCAHREAVDPDKSWPDVGFRCCRGATNAVKVVEPRLGKAYRRPHLALERIKALLAANPRTAAFAEDFILWREPDAANTVLERGSGDRRGLTFSVAPVIWNPVAGATYLVITGRSGKDTSMVLAYYVLGRDEYQLASSFIMKSETGPVALAYDDSIRPRLFFSTCWQCLGETGKVIYRDPDSVAIVQP